MPAVIDALRERVRGEIDAVAVIIGRSDQRRWADILRALRDRLASEPGPAARAILALFERDGAGPGRPAFDDLVLTYGGVAYRSTEAEWQEALRYARERSVLHESAMALWLAAEPHPFAALPPSPRAEKLVDWGGGFEVWRVGGGFVARYDCGAHVSRWRQDGIGADEAAQAALGPRNFVRMTVGLAERLKAAGVDPYAGSAVPPPNPT